MDLDTALDSWLRRHAENGSAVSAFLNPPATGAALDAAEERIGLALPPDLLRLWLRADGQRAVFDITDPSPGRLLCPLFGSYSFLSLGKALEAYAGWLDVYAGGGPEFDTAFNDEVSVQRRDGDPVYREYWRPGWLPFSEDGGGNAYAVDLSPAPGGAYGQVIVIGPDEDLRRVLAPSLTAFLAEAAARITVFASSSGEGPILFFDMEDR
ncbi:SMI1/KNR4 family protein [Roseomonas elaeocarpi]|uniref:SMI1/KNR4 family protein n=1 Tax=Roseomonas elaeocarpi TaxID=907779 RepID=A0ABV6JMF5_9PROT